MSITSLQNPAAMMLQQPALSALGSGSQLMGSVANVLQSLSGLLQALGPLLQRLGGGAGGMGGGMGMNPGATTLSQGMPNIPGGPLGQGGPTMMPALPGMGQQPGMGMPGMGMPPALGQPGNSHFGGLPNNGNFGGNFGLPNGGNFGGMPNGGIQTGNSFGNGGVNAGQIPMDNDRAVRELARNFTNLRGADEKLTVKDLKAIASGNIMNGKLSANYTPELRAAAQHILNNPSLMRQLDTADSVNSKGVGKADGKIGIGDVNAMLQRTGRAVGEEQTLQTLAKYGDQLFTNSGKTFNRQDMQTIASTGKMPNGSQAPADLQAAAKDLMARPELFNKLDNAVKIQREGKGDQRGDGKISVEDLKVAINGPQRIQTGHIQAPIIGQLDVARR
ncbi:HrpF/NolX family T3SS translocon protein [Eleftheria terrae]|uniref:HrpF/NolX family T3SS translocon protein n=1 Tax=Eleftheria terrae TaxID=1597781 RepID=UPI00263B4BB6|nr:HrpF/NolX family T3SS translocon protein [Eleftheria terrae]WKB51743.1 HrpF/NolX family T3SS translocon protein [Eleftheria terrae]